MFKKQELDAWLNQVDYANMDEGYVPSEFALTMLAFIKLVNGGAGESHKTPLVHLKMLDKLQTGSPKVANLCFRGAAKTTLFMEYLCLYIAFYGELPGFGDVPMMIYVSDSMENGVKSARKNIESRWDKSDFLREWVPESKFTDGAIEFKNKDGHKLDILMFGSKTGIRGTKREGKRPVLAVLDDLVSDEDSKSKTAMDTIKNTVYNGVQQALDPTRNKMIFNGTPFNKQDILIEAVESGAWDVNVWPVCERFPCEEHEFNGAWEDRFTYKHLRRQYDDAVLLGKVAGFNQELMLRLTSAEERLVQDEEIRWYSRQLLLNNKQNFNFYITTDFATSKKQTADWSVISVWAYNAKGDWFWVDGMLEKQTINKSFDTLFRLVQEYQPQQVGIEVSGQQQAYISLLQDKMMEKNIWFTFASSEKSGEPGIRPMADKLSRFNLVVPILKAGKVHFPKEMRTSVIMGEFMTELSLATFTGLKGKDDALDTISMLGYLKPWKPAETPIQSEGDSWWGDGTDQQELSGLASYIV